MSLIIGTKIVSDSIGFHVDFANRKCFSPNILNYSNWTVSSDGVAADVTRYGVTQYISNGQAGENSRVLGTDPFGYPQAFVWRAQNTDPNPGNSDGGFDTGNFPIDKSKMYRFSVWTKRNTMTSGGLNLESGSFYFGYYSKDSTQSFTFSITKSNGVPFSNPYFHVTPNPNPSNFSSIQAPFLGGLDVWTLVVGHVWPLGTSTGVTLPGTNINGLVSNTNHPDSGVWTSSSGKIGNLHMVGTGYGDGVWYPSSFFANHRAYLFYGADLTSVQSFIYPRVDIVDGLEPSIHELLSGSEPIRDLSPKMNVLYPLNTTDFDTNGRGLNFRGVEASIIRGAMSATFSAQTVSVWFSMTSTLTSATPGQSMLQFGPTSSSNYLAIGVGNSTGTVTDEVVNVVTDFTAVGGTLNLSAFTSNTFAFQAGIWYNLTLSWSGSKYLIYINGVEVATVAGGGSYAGRHAALPTSINMVHIGSASFTSGGIFYPYASNFNGKIGSVIVYERSLEAFEIISNYNATKQKYGVV